MNKLAFLKILFSPFKRFNVEFYIGKVAIGTPYFLPRRFVRKKSVPKLIGFDFVPLGWKLKWDDNDFRHEYNPVWSFVFFGLQIAISFHAPIDHQDSYWTAWLYYELRTDKTLSKAERIEICKEKFPVTWMINKDGNYVKTDYYQQILKPKYEIQKQAWRHIPFFV